MGGQDRGPDVLAKASIRPPVVGVCVMDRGGTLGGNTKLTNGLRTLGLTLLGAYCSVPLCPGASDRQQCPAGWLGRAGSKSSIFTHYCPEEGGRAVEEARIARSQFWDVPPDLS